MNSLSLLSSQAMHLVYKVLENNPMPSAIPQEMLSSAQRAGVAQGPVPAPLAPPSQIQQVDANKQQPKVWNSSYKVFVSLEQNRMKRNSS